MHSGTVARKFSTVYHDGRRSNGLQRFIPKGRNKGLFRLLAIGNEERGIGRHPRRLALAT
jgi:hypothetical protein